MEDEVENDCCISPPKVIISRKNRVVETEVCENQGGFPVQKIIGFYSGKEKAKYYRVQWVPTWIHEDGLINCDDLIKDFFVEQNIIKDVHGEPQKIKSENSHTCGNKSQGCESKSCEYASRSPVSEKGCSHNKKYLGCNIRYGGSKIKYRRHEKKLRHRDELCGCQLDKKSIGNSSKSQQINIKSENVNKHYTYNPCPEVRCSAQELQMNNLIGPGLDINHLMGRNISGQSSDTTKALIVTLEKLLADDDTTTTSTNIKRKCQTNKDSVHKEYSLRSTDENGPLQTSTEITGEKDNCLLNNDNLRSEQASQYQSTPQKRKSSMEGNQQVFIMHQGDMPSRVTPISHAVNDTEKSSDIRGGNLAATASLNPNSMDDKWGLCSALQSNRNATIIPNGVGSFSLDDKRKILPLKRKYRMTKGKGYSSGEEEWALRIGDKLPDGMKDWCGLKTKKERLDNDQKASGKKKISSLSDFAFSEQQIRLQVDDPAKEKALLDVQIRVSDNKSQPLVENLDSSSDIDEYLDSSDDEMDSCDDMLDSTFSYDEDMDESYYHEDSDNVPNCLKDKNAETGISSGDSISLTHSGRGNALENLISSEVIDIVVEHPNSSGDAINPLPNGKDLGKGSDLQHEIENPRSTVVTEEPSKSENKNSPSPGEDGIDRTNSCDEVMFDILNILDRLGPSDEVDQQSQVSDKEVSDQSIGDNISHQPCVSELLSQELKCPDAVVEKTISSECVTGHSDSEGINEDFRSSGGLINDGVILSEEFIDLNSCENFNGPNSVGDMIHHQTTTYSDSDSSDTTKKTKSCEDLTDVTDLKNNSGSCEINDKQPKCSDGVTACETKISEGKTDLSNSIENICEPWDSFEDMGIDETQQYDVDVEINSGEGMDKLHIGIKEVIIEETASSEIIVCSDFPEGVRQEFIPNEDGTAETIHSKDEVPSDIIEYPKNSPDYFHSQEVVYFPDACKLSGSMVVDQGKHLEDSNSPQNMYKDRTEQPNFCENVVSDTTGMDHSDIDSGVVGQVNSNEETADDKSEPPETITSNNFSEDIFKPSNCKDTAVNKTVPEDLNYELNCSKDSHKTAIKMASNTDLVTKNLACSNISVKDLDFDGNMTQSSDVHSCDHIGLHQSFGDSKTDNVSMNLVGDMTEESAFTTNKIIPTSMQIKQQHIDTILFDFDEEITSLEEKASSPAKSGRRRLGGMRASFHKRYKTNSSTSSASSSTSSHVPTLNNSIAPVCNADKVILGGVSWASKLLNDTLLDVCVEVMNEILSSVCDEENLPRELEVGRAATDKLLMQTNKMVCNGAPNNELKDCDNSLSTSSSPISQVISISITPNNKTHLVQENKLADQANELTGNRYSRSASSNLTELTSFNICNQEVSNGIELNEHLKSDRRRWLCVVCGGNFSGKAYVKKHLKRVHRLPDDIISGYADYAEQYGSLSNSGSQTAINTVAPALNELYSPPNSELSIICLNVLNDILDTVCSKSKLMGDLSSPIGSDKVNVRDSLVKVDDKISNNSLSNNSLSIIKGSYMYKAPIYIGNVCASDYLRNNMELLEEYLRTNLVEDNSRKWLCIVCGGTLTKKWNLKVHLKKVHRIANHLVAGYLELAEKHYPLSETLAEGKESIAPMASSSCVKDSIEIPTRVSYSPRRDNTVLNKEVEAENKVVNVSVDIEEFHDNSHNEVDYDKLYECDVCGKTFRSKFFLHRHRFLHNAKTARPSELHQKFNPNRMRWRSHCLRRSSVGESV